MRAAKFWRPSQSLLIYDVIFRLGYIFDATAFIKFNTQWRLWVCLSLFSWSSIYIFQTNAQIQYSKNTSVVIDCQNEVRRVQNGMSMGLVWHDVAGVNMNYFLYMCRTTHGTWCHKKVLIGMQGCSVLTFLFFLAYCAFFPKFQNTHVKLSLGKCPLQWLSLFIISYDWLSRAYFHLLSYVI